MGSWHDRSGVICRILNIGNYCNLILIDSLKSLFLALSVEQCRSKGNISGGARKCWRREPLGPVWGHAPPEKFEIWRQYRASVAHLVVHRAVTREVSSRLPPDQHSGSLNNWGEKCCLCNFICKWLDFLVFSDKDDKPEVPSHNSLNVDNSVGR